MTGADAFDQMPHRRLGLRIAAGARRWESVLGRMSNKSVMVTGAARGIGFAIAALMAEEEADVLVSDVDSEAVEAAASRLSAQTGRHVVHAHHDVTSPADWSLALQKAESELGGLNVLVNNAGICVPGTVEDLSEADWDRTLDVDLRSVFLGCKAALPMLARFAPGAIVNISSIAGIVAGHNLVAYNAAKAGVWMLTKSVALHAAREGYNVRVNSIHPAFVETGMIDDVLGGSESNAAREKLARQIPLKRLGTARDVAYAALYLASDESAFMTGAEIKLDGGLSAM